MVRFCLHSSQFCSCASLFETAVPFTSASSTIEDCFSGDGCKNDCGWNFGIHAAHNIASRRNRTLSANR